MTDRNWLDLIITKRLTSRLRNDLVRVESLVLTHPLLNRWFDNKTRQCLYVAVDVFVTDDANHWDRMSYCRPHTHTLPPQTLRPASCNVRECGSEIMYRVVGFLWCLCCIKLWDLGGATAATRVVTGGAYIVISEGWMTVYSHSWNKSETHAESGLSTRKTCHS